MAKTTEMNQINLKAFKTIELGSGRLACESSSDNKQTLSTTSCFGTTQSKNLMAMSPYAVLKFVLWSNSFFVPLPMYP